MKLQRDKFRFKRLDAKTTVIYYPPLNKKPYITNILVYDNGQFNIENSFYASTLHNDLRFLQNILFNENVLNAIHANQKINEIVGLD